MKYYKLGSEYFRNKKGGGLGTNGKLNAANFSNETVELQEMNSSNKKINPIKIMVKKIQDLHLYFVNYLNLMMNIMFFLD